MQKSNPTTVSWSFLNLYTFFRSKWLQDTFTPAEEYWRDWHILCLLQIRLLVPFSLDRKHWNRTDERHQTHLRQVKNINTNKNSLLPNIFGTSASWPVWPQDTSNPTPNFFNPKCCPGLELLAPLLATLFLQQILQQGRRPDVLNNTPATRNAFQAVKALSPCSPWRCFDWDRSIIFPWTYLVATQAQWTMNLEILPTPGCSQDASNLPDVLQEQLWESKAQATWFKQIRKSLAQQEPDGKE